MGSYMQGMDAVAELEIKSGPKKKKSRAAFTLRALLFLTAFALIALFCMTAPFFEISAVEITGNSRLSADKIKSMLGINVEEGVNYFLLNKTKIRESLFESPYVKSVVVTASFKLLKVEITERIPRCYVEYKSANSFLLIDESGVVLETQSYMREKLPVITGLKYDSFFIGKRLETYDNDNFNNVVLISRIFTKYEMDNVFKIDASDKDSIHIFINGIDITFGSMDDSDEKVRMIKAILEKDLPPGFLDVSDLSRGSVFSPLK